MSSDIERWMRNIEQTLAEHDRRIRSKPSSDTTTGAPPSGPAGGALTGSYPNPTLASGSVTGGPGGAIADNTITDADVASANKDGAAGTASMRTLGTGAQQAAAGNDARLSDARTPLAHQHDGADITSGTVGFARLPTGTTSSTVAVGNHTHTWDGIVAGGTLDVPIVQDRIATPGSIPAGAQALYPKSDGRYYVVSSDGVERPLIPVPDQLHSNPSFDSVSMSTDGPGDSTVAARLTPDSWDNFWSNGVAAGHGPIISADETVTREGLGYSYKVELPWVNESGQTLQSSVFAVTGGSLVTASAWVKGTSGPKVALAIYSSLPANDPSFFQPAGTTYSVQSPEIVPGSDWQKITVSMVVPGGHTKCRIMLRNSSLDGAAAGTIWWDDTESSRIVSPPASVVSGEIKMWPTATAPDGYLLCNGGTFSSSTYPTLAALLGDTFGTHSGSTYYLPDLRGRSPIGVGATGQGNNYSLGLKWGHEGLQAHSHTQSGHYHGGTTGSQNRFHVHNQYVSANVGMGSGIRWDYDTDAGSLGAYSQNTNTDTESAWHEHAFNTDTQTPAIQSTGSGNNGSVHPVLALNFIIKT